jgi:hypothetical protein
MSDYEDEDDSFSDASTQNEYQPPSDNDENEESEYSQHTKVRV